jgi:peptidoglycan hydrolase-like protein with peptidoglycan-binding domain
MALRGRAGVVLAVVLSTVAAGGALAQDASAPDTIQAVQQKLGVKADGVYGPKTRAAVRRFQRAHGLTVDGIIGPETLAELGIGRAADAPSSDPSSGADATLQRIAQCESGGDPTAVSSDGTYRGKYQFDRATWARLGGEGDPADAPEAEQDRLAAKLFAAEGTDPWPVCGQAA